MEQLRELLTKFRNGTATDEERNRLLILLRAHSAAIKIKHWKAFQKQLDQPTASTLSNERRKRLLDNIHQQLALPDAPQQDAPSMPNATRRNLFPIVRVAVAALAIFLLGAVIAVKMYQQAQQHGEQGLSRDGFVVKQNTSTHILAFVLPDSSKIHLAPGAAIHYQPGFNATHRNLQLEGNARFDVAKNKALPFRVASRGYTVTALGTIFLINGAQEDRLQVQLLEGKIGVGKTNVNQQNEHILLPGEELFIDLQQQSVKKYTIAHTNTAAAVQPSALHSAAKATDGQKKVVFHFTDTPIATVIAQLEVLYGKKIVYDEKLLQQQTYSGRLSLGDGTSLDSLRETLRLLFNEDQLRYTMESDRLLISTPETPKNN